MHGAIIHTVSILSRPAQSPHLKCTSVCYAVIKSFGKRIGADNKQVQGLVRLAKQNGEKLGFLA